MGWNPFRKNGACLWHSFFIWQLLGNKKFKGNGLNPIPNKKGVPKALLFLFDNFWGIKNLRGMGWNPFRKNGECLWHSFLFDNFWGIKKFSGNGLKSIPKKKGVPLALLFLIWNIWQFKIFCWDGLQSIPMLIKN